VLDFGEDGVELGRDAGGLREVGVVDDLPDRAAAGGGAGEELVGALGDGLQTVHLLTHAGHHFADVLRLGCV
jgi:hypothetical protein